MGKSSKRKGIEDRANANILNEIIALEPVSVSDSKEVINEKLGKTAKALHGLMTQDAFQNKLARLGFEQPNLAEGADYVITRQSYNWTQFTAMYRSSWICRKICDVIPSDMVKKWISIKTKEEADNINKVERLVNTTRTKQRIKEGLTWARLYGGAIGIIIIDGCEDLSEPLDYDEIMPGQYKGLLIFDRWSGVYPDTVNLITDINDVDFGLPDYYDINVANALNNSSINSSLKENQYKVHHSRVIRFSGRELPYFEKIYDQFWGESEIEITLEELKKRDNTSANISSLIFMANLRVLKMNDLGQLLGAGSEVAQRNLWNVLEAQNQLMSSQGIYVMDKEDDFDTKQYSFGGLNDIYESFMLDVAGACEMPVTKLFGRNPAGFNSTGESDLKQYYETVEEKQEYTLKPIIDKLLPIICMSALGKYPEDLEWEFNPIMSVSNQDMADLASAYTSPILEVFNAGLINKKVALQELKKASEITGMFGSITDKMIEEAENDDQVYGEGDEEDLENEMALEDSKTTSPEQNKINDINTKEEAKDDKKDWKENFFERFSKKFSG